MTRFQATTEIAVGIAPQLKRRSMKWRKLNSKRKTSKKLLINSLQLIFSIHEFKDDSEITEHIDNIMKQIPNKQEYTNNI